MASPTQPCYGSYRASWMYSDPYAYQYIDVNRDADIPVSPRRERVAAGSFLCELEGSTSTDNSRYELAANTQVEAVRDNHGPVIEPSSPCGLSRNRLSNVHTSVRYPNRRGHVRAASVHTAPAPRTPRVCPPQPCSSGLIPVLEGAPTPVQNYVPEPVPRWCPRPSPPAYADGLIPVDENATTPKEPSSDFDAILRNIGAIDKKGKGNKGRERSSRYYDRYSSNFG